MNTAAALGLVIKLIPNQAMLSGNSGPQAAQTLTLGTGLFGLETVQNA